MRRIATLVVLAFASVPRVAWAGPEGEAERTKQQCVVAAEQGQRSRDDGHLIDARAAFLRCASTECPAILQKDCASFLADVDRRTPSVVISTKRQDGSDAVGVSTSVDGHLTAGADGRALLLDPGAHSIAVKAAGGVAPEQRIIVHESEHERLLTFVLISPPGAAPPPEPAPVSSTTNGRAPLLAIVGVAGAVISFAFATGIVVDARGRADDLRRSCAPRCDPSDVDSIRTERNVAFVVGGVGIGLAALGAFGLFRWLTPARADASRAPQWLRGTF